MLRTFLTGAALLAATPALVAGAMAHSVTSAPNDAVLASFDIIETSIVI